MLPRPTLFFWSLRCKESFFEDTGWLWTNFHRSPKGQGKKNCRMHTGCLGHLLTPNPSILGFHWELCSSWTGRSHFPFNPFLHTPKPCWLQPQESFQRIRKSLLYTALRKEGFKITDYVSIFLSVLSVCHSRIHSFQLSTFNNSYLLEPTTRTAFISMVGKST